ncbi:hypothetical protein CLOM_g20409 [Closterium sp. NIES-68]|nr:hypothetical protein CLOM_g20409 [Closterium sp. NIES-68]GJP71331.1 hypothetical protein CLOP_g2171 [Closterium sp. NIES-67]
MALSLARTQALSTCLPAASHLSFLLLRALHRTSAHPAVHPAAKGQSQQPSQRQIRSVHSGGGAAPPIPSFWSPSAESTTDSAELSALECALLGGSTAGSPAVAWRSHATAQETLLDSISQQQQQATQLSENEAVSLDSVLRIFSAPKPNPFSQSWDAQTTPSDATLAALSEHTLAGMPEQGWRATWRDENVCSTDEMDSRRGYVQDMPIPDFLAADSAAFLVGSEKNRSLPSVSIAAGVVFELDD